MSFADYVYAHALACSGKAIPPDRVLDVFSILPPPQVSFDTWLDVRKTLQEAGKPSLPQEEICSELNKAMVEKASRGGLAIDAGILTVEKVDDAG